MLILILVALLLNYWILPAIKDAGQGMFETWNRTLGIIFLIPGVSLIVGLVIVISAIVIILMMCIEMAIEENFIENYFKYEK